MTADYTPREGDRVRVVIEGLIELVGSDGQIEVCGHEIDPMLNGVTVERAPDSRPAWAIGDQVAFGGEVVVRIGHGEWARVSTDGLAWSSLQDWHLRRAVGEGRATVLRRDGVVQS